ncbi:MAG: hypothetical protein R2705_03865 [Ilumatobacteraceae bacterium]
MAPETFTRSGAFSVMVATIGDGGEDLGHHASLSPRRYRGRTLRPGPPARGPFGRLVPRDLQSLERVPDQASYQLVIVDSRTGCLR